MRQDIIFASIPSMSELTAVVVVGYLLFLPLVTLLFAVLAMEVFRAPTR